MRKIKIKNLALYIGIIIILILLAGSIYVMKIISQPDYELIINYSSFTPGKTGPVKVCKMYTNGTLKELYFPGDTFENVGRNFKYRRQYEEKGYIFNITPAKIVWNGKYYLMDNSYSLIKYDGRKFEVYRYVEGYYSPLSILGMYYLRNRWFLVYLDDGISLRIRILKEENLSNYTEYKIPISIRMI